MTETLQERYEEFRKLNHWDFQNKSSQIFKLLTEYRDLLVACRDLLVGYQDDKRLEIEGLKKALAGYPKMIKRIDSREGKELNDVEKTLTKLTAALEK